MANVQKENGYTPIANEILEHICQIKLNGTQFKIILVIWRYTYGFSRKEHELSESFLAKATNTHKIQLSKEINKLIELKIIQVIRAATFTQSRILCFNKNYSEWIGIQLVNSLTHNKEDNTAVSESTNTTVSESTNQEIQNLKQNLKKDKCNFQQVIDLYNEICISLPKVTKLSDARKKAIKARYKSYTTEDFRKLFTMAEESDFLSGRKTPNTWCSFDWLMKDNNIVKVLDGNYSNKGSVNDAGKLCNNGFGHVKSAGELMDEYRAAAEARGETYKAPDVDNIF